MNIMHSFYRLMVLAVTIITLCSSGTLSFAANNNVTAQNKVMLPAHRIYHGVCINPESSNFEENLANYTNLVGRRPAVVTFFAHVWNRGKFQDWKYFGKLLQKVDAAGAIPFVKATTADWDQKSGLSWTADNILAGKYDTYFIEAATAAKEFGKPMLLSWNHEMNGDWYPWSEAFARKYPNKSDWTAEKYVKVWQHIVKIYRKQGASNVAFAWAPDVEGRKLGSYEAIESWKAYWPGGSYVDWITPSLYNNINPIQLDSIANANKEKPIYISEWGTCVNRRKWYRFIYPGDAEWIKQFFELMLNRYSNVKGMSYFQWEPAYYLQRDAGQTETYRHFIQNNRFVNGPL